MAGKKTQRVSVLLITVLFAMVLACACTIRRTTTSPETTISETTEEPVYIKPEPNNNELTDTPTPTPASVYIPVEDLPDGQILEKGYYAILPGEGAYCNVFDCYGKQVASFLYTDGESGPPTGVYTEQRLSRFYRFNESEIQSILPENHERTWIESNENGFYEIDYEKSHVILYNKEGKHIQTLSQDPDLEAPEDELQWVDIVVESYGNETVISFSTFDWDPESSSVTIYFVAADGTINDTCAAGNLPRSVLGLLGRKYFLVRGEDGDADTCDVYDFDGNLIIEKVSIIGGDSFTLWSSEASTYIRVSDYYMKDGITYDSSFRAISKNEVDPDGNLIYGVKYDVDGITCKAEYSKKSPFFYASDPADLVAVGTKDGLTAIKTCDSEYVFDCIGDYYSMNDYVLVLSDQNYNKKVISLKTGDVLKDIKYNGAAVIVADEYILVRFSEYVQQMEEYTQSISIIDKSGNIRYVSQDAYAETTLGEHIVLSRGPYVGIADLNGEWILKSLTWEMTRDQEYVYTGQ